MKVGLPQLRPARPPVATTPEVDALLAAHAPVAFGVSGGIDGAAAVLHTNRYLDAIGHAGPRLLIHSDLGDVEWVDSLPSCERLAAHTGLDLVTVSAGRGGLMGRWERRWQSSLRRYAELLCVKMILPWSTAAMRFCTSEMKTDVICRELRRRFPGQGILSVTGIRRDESPNRAKAPIAKPQKKLSDAAGTWGLDWHPIPDFTKPQCFQLHDDEGLRAHQAYGTFGSSRVSCVFCILASRADLLAASVVPANAAIYRRMVALVIASAFSFRGDGWLGDLASHLLSDGMLDGLERAKAIAAARARAEARIHKDLLYTSGWPRVIPTRSYAAVIADVRREVGQLMAMSISYTTPGEVIDRYQDLWKKNQRRAA